MGKPIKKKSQSSTEKAIKHNKTFSSDRASKNIDEDTAVFIQMSQEIKEEGNKLFLNNDNEGAMLKYEKALKLLPSNHIDVAYLRSKMASCYMKLGVGEYPRAIHECNLALEVASKYSKALLTRARCYIALSKFDLALKDVTNVLCMEPNNLNALEVEGLVKKGMGVEDNGVRLVDEYVEPSLVKKVEVVKEKVKKKKKKKGNKASVKEEKAAIGNKTSVKEEKAAMRSVKMVLGDDIRWMELPVNCSIGLVREIIRERYPGLDGVLIKYKDQEGDLVTILTTSELRLAEELCDPEGSFRLYLVETSYDKEPLYEGLKSGQLSNPDSLISTTRNVEKNGEIEKRKSFIEEWVAEFAKVFKNHVGFDTNPYLDLHEVGMELFSAAMDDNVTTEISQNIIDIAGEKFQDQSALALFNWGNVHLNKARKMVVVAEENERSQELVAEQVKVGYEWAQREYVKAGKRYEESLKVKPDFYEGHLALGLQQFEQAKLSWYYNTRSKSNIEEGVSIQILELYNKAEDNMEKGMQICEEIEERRLNGLGLSDKRRVELMNVGLEGILRDVSADDVAEQAVHIKSQIYILWGTLLYERSVMEFKLSLPSWEECLEVAVEKFELAGASETDITVIIKNHCSNGTALEGLSFKIDEIVQAWNEMFDTKRWQTGDPLFPLEPLFRRRVPKLHSFMEHY